MTLELSPAIGFSEAETLSLELHSKALLAAISNMFNDPVMKANLSLIDEVTDSATTALDEGLTEVYMDTGDEDLNIGDDAEEEFYNTTDDSLSRLTEGDLESPSTAEEDITDGPLE